MVVAGAIELGAAGSITSTSRLATRANARRHPGRIIRRRDRAEGGEAGEVGLGRGQADRLDADALDCGDRVVECGRAALVLAVRQHDEHLVLDGRREVGPAPTTTS